MPVTKAVRQSGGAAGHYNAGGGNGKVCGVVGKEELVIDVR